MKQIVTPYWLLAIRYFLRHHYISNGLTIPYLIGARAILEPTLPHLSIGDLLIQAAKQPAGITLMRCGNIGEYVVADLDQESNRYSHLFKRFGHLHITDDSFESITTLPDLIEVMTVEYAKYIHEGCYSKISGQWGPFNNMDIQQLEAVRKNSL